jgi:serine/threonine protein kinase
MVGRTLGRYKLVEEIGQGGMAVVYRGLDTTLHREVAVKILHPHLSRKEANRVRFAREARVVATLHHDNIVEIYDFSGGDEGDAFIVCEYIRGRTLADFIEKNPPLPVEIAVMMIAEIGQALCHAHAQGIIHRDIKPENVMIRQDGVLKLMDFGIARVQEDTGSTMTGALIGSPAYMSPEQVGGHSVDIRSDLFAAAVILYRLVGGRLPFDAPTPAAILRAVETVDPVPPERLNPLVSRGLDRVILRALSKDPEKRQANVDELTREALATIADAKLGTPREELKSYFADPEGYSAKLRSALTLRYAKAGHERRAAGDTAAAMEIWSRVLEMDPSNADVKKALENLSIGNGRRRLARVAFASVAALALAGSAGAAAWNVWPERAVAVSTPTPLAITPTPAAPTATMTLTAAVSPAPTPVRTAATPTPTPIPTASGTKTVAVAAVSPSPAGTLVAMIPTPTPIPAGAAILEFDMAQQGTIWIGVGQGINVGTTDVARRGLLISAARVEQLRGLSDPSGLAQVKVMPTRSEDGALDPRLVGCRPLIGSVRLDANRRLMLLDTSGTRVLRQEELYMQGCPTIFRVEVPPGAEKAVVKIDGQDKPLGGVFETLKTTSGVHELSVRAPGYEPWKQRVEIRTVSGIEGEPFVIRVPLEPSS